MIHRAKFQNFKALKDVEVTFDERLTVLVGPNGSGKSSVLRGIYWLCQLATSGPEHDAAIQQIRLGNPDSFSGRHDNQLIAINEQGDFNLSGLRYVFHPNGDSPEVDQWNAPSIEIRPFEVGSYTYSFTPAELIQLHAGALAGPSLTTTVPPLMQPQGGGLASLMAYYKNEDEPRFHRMVDLFRMLIPRVKGIRITRVNTGNGGALGEGLLFDLPGRKGVPASAMSDGTLYALGLIVKILDPQRPKTLLIDDIDHGFHPKAQLTLVELLHKLLDEIPDLQIIATSHSPYILDRLKWSEVRVTSLKDDGSAVVARLEDHPDFDRWKDSMSPGEFWSTFYEEWATKTKPAPQPVP